MAYWTWNQQPYNVTVKLSFIGFIPKSQWINSLPREKHWLNNRRKNIHGNTFQLTSIPQIFRQGEFPTNNLKIHLLDEWSYMVNRTIQIPVVGNLKDVYFDNLHRQWKSESWTREYHHSWSQQHHKHTKVQQSTKTNQSHILCSEILKSLQIIHWKQPSRKEKLC